MAAIGGKYDYDVFFSYAWAVEATEDDYFRNWCRAVADRIRALLRVRFNVNGKQLKTYLDRDEAKSGQALIEVLKQAAEQSALFIAFVSDHYNSAWCERELQWFCGRITAEHAALMDHLCVIRVQRPSEGRWPKLLTGPDGSPLLYQDFCTPEGQPINFAQFVNGAATPDLADPIEKAAVEIGDKLKAIEAKLGARSSYDQSQLSPEYPVLYLDAETADQARWIEIVRMLKETPSIVLPAPQPKPATDAELAGCDGLLLLRSRQGDDIGSRIKRAYRDRRQLLRNSAQQVPWALLDDQEEAPAECEPFRIPRIRPEGDWPHEVARALFGG